MNLTFEDIFKKFTTFNEQIEELEGELNEFAEGEPEPLKKATLTFNKGVSIACTPAPVEDEAELEEVVDDVPPAEEVVKENDESDDEVPPVEDEVAEPTPKEFKAEDAVVVSVVSEDEEAKTIEVQFDDGCIGTVSLEDASVEYMPEEEESEEDEVGGVEEKED